MRAKLQYEIVSLENSFSFPLASLLKDPSELVHKIEGKEKVYIMCRRGNASKEATEFLLNKCNIINVVNVQGGITEYITKIDSTLPIY